METTSFASSALPRVELERYADSYLFRVGDGPQRIAATGSAEQDACRQLDRLIDDPATCPQQEEDLIACLVEADAEAREAELARLFQPDAFPLLAHL